MTSTRIFLITVVALLLAAGGALTSPGVTRATTCFPTNFSRDNHDLTAAVIAGSGDDISGDIDATTCDIGVYVEPGVTDVKIDNADIHGAKYFGVAVNGAAPGASADVTNSSIYDIGESPFNGAQHGVGIYYVAMGSSDSATGTVSGNTVSNYQKGGIVANGSGASVSVTDNTVTGLGPVPFIAQNGIQFGWGATVLGLSGNTVTGNIYTQGAAKAYVSSGILLYQATLTTNVGQIASANHSYGNQANIFYIK